MILPSFTPPILVEIESYKFNYVFKKNLHTNTEFVALKLVLYFLPAYDLSCAPLL